MRISIHHQFSVTPPPGTTNLVMQLLLTPLSGPTQDVESWTVDVAGIDSAAKFGDAYGNTMHMVNQSKPEGEVLITVSGVVNTRDMHGVLGRPGGEPVAALYTRATSLTKAPVTLYGKYRGGKDSRLDVLHGLMLRVSDMLGAAAPPAPTETENLPSSAAGGMSQTMGGMNQSLAGMTQTMNANGSGANAEPVVASASSLPDGDNPVIEEAGHEVVVRLPRAPATDFAHMFIGGARALGIPARFVTGYLVAEDDEPAQFHAWAEAYTEKLGWIGFDPMLELCPTDRHVRLAVGLDALSTAPIRCVPAGDGVVEVSVTVEREEIA